MVLTFPVFDHKYHSCKNLVQKLKNCLFKAEFDTKTNSNMQNSMVVSILSVLDLKVPFLANLVQKIATVSLS